MTAATSEIADADGLTNVSYSYQWIANDGTSDTAISGATNSTYTLVNADEGGTIKVRVSFTDDAANAESLTSAATATVDAAPNSPATGAPGIIGTAQVGETLTAATSGIADADGLANVAYGYQWIANDGTSDTAISGATNSTYTLVAADEGKTIKVRVSFTDDAGHGETLTSAATGIVAAALLPLTVRLGEQSSHAQRHGRIHLRNPVQRGVPSELPDSEGPCAPGDWGNGEESAAGGQFQRHPLANHCATGR